MGRWEKTTVVFVIAGALIFTTTGFQAVAQDQKSPKKAPALIMIADFLVARPVGFIMTAAGTVVFVGSLPFTALGGNTKAAYEQLIKDPAQFTFSRPLGNFDVEY